MSWVTKLEAEARYREYEDRIAILLRSNERLEASNIHLRAEQLKKVVELQRDKDQQIEQWKVNHAQVVERLTQAEEEITRLGRKVIDLRRKVECQAG